MEEQKMLKDNLTKTFFAVAPVPKSLKLAHGNPIVAQELDLKHTVGYIDPSNGTTFAIMMFSMWDVDKSYDSFPVDALEWLNMAGVIANELASTDVEAYAIWRDMQYQLIYYLSQGGAQSTGEAKKIVYVSFGVMEDKYRAKYKNTLASSAVRFMTRGMPQDHYATTLTTLRGHRKQMYTYQADGVHELCYIPYADLTFARGGRMVFEGVVDMEGLALHGCEGKKP